MRERTVAQRSVFDQAIDLFACIFKPTRKLKNMDSVIDANPDTVQAVYADLTKGLTDSGRPGISAERVLRSAILKQWKGYSYRELHERINDCVSFRWFTRFYSDSIPHYKALQRAIKSIHAQTWNRINEMPVNCAKERKVESGRNQYCLSC